MKRIFPISFLLLASAYVTAPCETLTHHIGAAYAPSGSTHVMALTSRTQDPPRGKAKDSTQDRRKDSPYKKHVHRLYTGRPKIAVAIVDASQFPSGHTHYSITHGVTQGVSILSDHTSSIICDRSPPGV